MTTTQTTDQNLAADTQPGPFAPGEVFGPVQSWPNDSTDGSWTAADERAFADAPLYLSGPARYSVVPCRACEMGGELPCPDCGAVASGEQYD